MNEYVIDGETVTFELRRRRLGPLYTQVSLDDLPRILTHGYRVGPIYDHTTRRYYARIGIGNERQALLHRWLLDAPPDLQVDHRDGEPLNNQRHNLRLVDGTTNQLNRRGPQRNNKSGYRGVLHMRSGKYVAQIKVMGTVIYLGTYASVEEAVAAHAGALKTATVWAESIPLRGGK